MEAILSVIGIVDVYRLFREDSLYSKTFTAVNEVIHGIGCTIAGENNFSFPRGYISSSSSGNLKIGSLNDNNESIPWWITRVSEFLGNIN